jgi:TPR repeat protein
MSLRNFHSDVLVAYATALFRLGWRYERGRGAPRNVAEAIRCYCKSARLGNRSAAARLDESSHFPS